MGNEEKLVIDSLLKAAGELTMRVGVVQAGLESLLRVLPEQIGDAFAVEFRESVEELLDAMDHVPGRDALLPAVTTAVNALLESAGQSPGQPGTPE